MQAMKSIEIGNRKLYRIAKKMNLSQYMLIKKYQTEHYKVPGFPPKGDLEDLYNRDIPYKRVADVVEALLGVAFESRGFDGAYDLMKWVNHGIVRLPYHHPPEDPELLRDATICKNIATLETKLQYKFKHRIYPIIALCLKASSRRDLVERSERLEFLGDAVLDVLVTEFIFKNRGNKIDQDDLTNWRSDIVCNDTLAQISYNLKFPDLFIDLDSNFQQAVTNFYAKRNIDIENPRELIRRNRPAVAYKYTKSMSDIVELFNW
eukprot:TRINITY_DN1051_c0_g1_i1.p1 TRINITY_DN1051_c0_g1~~TRINITY_DN1051_c0_g1_i1.p1  ORF type:complete len:263 (-),score=55.59 TRINITY_DN1051_c0_g1_i1:119-907(-)